MSTNAPTFDQRMAALALANAVRTSNANTLKRIASMPYLDGIDAVIELLRDADEKGPFGVLTIRRLLLAPAKFGEGKVNDLLRAAGIGTGDRRLRQLTRRQREKLAFHLEHPQTLWPATRIPQQRRARAAA